MPSLIKTLAYQVGVGLILGILGYVVGYSTVMVFHGLGQAVLDGIMQMSQMRPF